MADVRVGQPDFRNIVYFSSTFSDLQQERRAAIDAIWSLDLYPVAIEQEVFPQVSPVAQALTLVDTATVFISILGHLYGVIPPGYDTSITELEYNRARERNIPILAFMRDDAATVRLSDTEGDPTKSKSCKHSSGD